MAKRPVFILLAALLFLYFPIEMVYRWLHGGRIDAVDIVLSVALPAMLIFGLVRVTMIGWYTLVTLIALWGLRDLQHFYSSQSKSLTPLIAHIIIYVVSLGYFINPRIRHLYFDPKSRWWKTKLRYETHLPFMMSYKNEWQYPVLRNISEGGCFIETPHLLEMNTSMQIAIPLPVPLNVSVIKTEGVVRWVSNNPLRRGMGIQFVEPRDIHSKAIAEFVQRQL